LRYDGEIVVNYIPKIFRRNFMCNAESLVVANESSCAILVVANGGGLLVYYIL